MQKKMDRFLRNYLLMSLMATLCVFIAACGGGSSGGGTTAAPAAVPLFTPPPGISVNITKIDTASCPEIDVYLSVTNEQSQTMINLTAQNFDLLEDGVQQALTSISFENIITESIVFSMAMDYSLSLSDQDLLKIEEAATYFVNELFNVTSTNLLDNWGEIIKFVKDSEVIQEFTNDKAELLSGIDSPSQLRLISQAHTGLFDSIGTSIDRLIDFRNNPPTAIPDRSILIVITDGKNNDSVLTEADNIASATAGGIHIITIGIGSNIDGQSLYNLAMDTGGLYFYAPTADDLITIFTQYLENLKNQYVLKYNTGNFPGVNMVEVMVDTPDGSDSDALAYACP